VYIIFSLHCLALWKTIWRLLIKLKIELPYDPEILLLGIYPNECKSRYNKDICTQMFIAALAVHNSQTMEATQMPYKAVD
jgi:hypothetical protein